MSRKSVPRPTQPRSAERAALPPPEEWFENHSPSTRRAYRSDVLGLLKFLEHDPSDLGEISSADIAAWRSSPEVSKLRAGTIRRKLSAVGALFSELVASGLVASNPVAGIDRPNEGANEAPEAGLTDEEAQRLIRAASDDSMASRRQRAVLALLLETGLSSAEAAELKRRDLQFVDGHAVVTVEGRRRRDVELSESAERAISSYLERLDHEPSAESGLLQPLRLLYGGGAVQALREITIRTQILPAIAEAAGFEPGEITARRLRATAAASLFAAGVSVRSVAQRLGMSELAAGRYAGRRTETEE